jgi:hypothetical protein
MTRVYFDHLYSPFLGLVDNKPIKLGKAPTVQASFRIVFLALADFRGRSYILEVFQSDGTPRSSVLDNMLTEDMITIPVESQSLPRQLLEMSFSTFCSFRLQFSLETETASVNLFPMPTTQEVTGGSDSGTLQAQINTDNLWIGRDVRFRDADHYMQPELPMPVAQVSSRDGMTVILGTIRGDAERNAHSATSGGQTYLVLLPGEDVGFVIVTHGTEFAVRTRDGLELRERLALLSGFLNAFGIVSDLLSLPRQGRLHRFGSFDTSLNEQITDQSRTGRFGLTIGRMMQLHPVPLFVLPPIGNYRVKGRSELLKRLSEGLSLL